jgi:hypothetical protein
MNSQANPNNMEVEDDHNLSESEEMKTNKEDNDPQLSHQHQAHQVNKVYSSVN